MREPETTDQLYELDRALLDEHGASYIDTVADFAHGMRSEGRDADADDALLQCIRMRAILMHDAQLLARYAALDGKPGDRVADAPCAEINRRDLST